MTFVQDTYIRLQYIIRMFFVINILFFALIVTMQANHTIDVVIPCHAKDMRTLGRAIRGIKKHGKHIRRVIVVSAERLTTEAEWCDERVYPFTKDDLVRAIFEHNAGGLDAYNKAGRPRIGWLYQQLLKLYAPFVIPQISSNVLVLDADTIFLRDIEFIDNEGFALFNVGNEHHIPYFEHAGRLVPGLQKVYPQYSGITHHMLFQNHILEDLFKEIVHVHNTEPWKALCACIDHQHLRESALSEYEIYFNFAFSRNYKVKIRSLKWENALFDEGSIKRHQQAGYHYISCHLWDCYA